jgi:hypothetical protein
MGLCPKFPQYFVQHRSRYKHIASMQIGRTGQYSGSGLSLFSRCCRQIPGDSTQKAFSRYIAISTSVAPRVRQGLERRGIVQRHYFDLAPDSTSGIDRFYLQKPNLVFLRIKRLVPVVRRDVWFIVRGSYG